MKKEVIIFLISLVFITSFIYAAFSTGDSVHEIETQYSSSDFIKGWINISLVNEKANSLFEDSFGNSIKLIDLLKLNNGSDYTCSPSDCNSNFMESNQAPSKTFTLNRNEQKTFGFKFTGEEFEEVSSFSINISSNLAQSNSKKLFIDVLSDDEVEWHPYRASNNFGSEDYGCYETSSEESLIYNEEYCETINIPVSPNVEIGAYVIEETGEDAVFTLSLNGDGSSGSCEVIASATGRISCVPDMRIDKKQDFDVCLRTKTNSDNNKFKINSETNEACGYAGSEDNKRDFEIFVKQGKYAAIGNFLLADEEIQGSGSLTDVETYVGNYMDRYGGTCTDGCVFPITFISEENDQEITISNVSIFYVVSGTPIETEEIYELTEEQAEINSDFQKIDLDSAGFSVSGEFNEESTYILDLNGEEILFESISFKKIPSIISLNPTTVIAAFVTKFTIIAQGLDSNITSYEWDFGTEKKTTTENKITYTYPSLGTYKLTVKTTDDKGISISRTFDINVKTPKDAIGSVLERELKKLEKITAQVETFQTFHKASLMKILNLTEIESDVIYLQKRNSTAKTDEDYVSIMSDLVDLDIPESILETKTAESIKFLPYEDNVNIEILKEIARGEYVEDEEELYRQAVVTWNIENMDTRITFKELSGKYEEITLQILNTFELKISAKENRDDFYFIIENLEDLEFKENYGQRKILGYNYIKLGPEEKIIEFTTTEDLYFFDLPAFMSPEIKKLTIVREESISEAEEKSKILLFLLFLFILAIGFVVYIILQEWYKRRYEDFLFKDKNNLYNIISYIENAKKRGTKNEDIAKGLKKVGWNKEQTDYVMKKYVGKRTGMFEIPVQKILDIFKKKKMKEMQQKNIQNKSVKATTNNTQNTKKPIQKTDQKPIQKFLNIFKKKETQQIPQETKKVVPNKEIQDKNKKLGK